MRFGRRWNHKIKNWKAFEPRRTKISYLSYLWMRSRYVIIFFSPCCAVANNGSTPRQMKSVNLQTGTVQWTTKSCICGRVEAAIQQPFEFVPVPRSLGVSREDLQRLEDSTPKLRMRSIRRDEWWLEERSRSKDKYHIISHLLDNKDEISHHPKYNQVD